MGRDQSTLGTGTAALLVVVIVAVLLVVSGGASGAGSQSGSASTSFLGPQPAYGVEIDPDNVLMEITLQPNGTATLRIEYRIELDDRNTTDAFERHREDIESNPGQYRDGFRTDMESTVDNAESATGREMGVANVSVDVRREALPPESGVITYRFEWVGFAATDGTELEAGDALSGIYLDEETTLIVGWPEEYERASVTPTPAETREHSIVWSGPLYFTGNEPSLVVSEAGTTTPPGVAGEGPTTTPGGVQVVNDDGRTIAALLGLGVVLALLGLVYYRSDWGGIGGSRAESAVSGDGIAGAERAADDTDGGRVGDAKAAGGGAGSSGSELLSNEEQVLGVLNDHGGRLRQQEIAAELDWTDAKTSKVVGEMREDDAIETFRLGRENVVTLPDTGIEDDI